VDEDCTVRVASPLRSYTGGAASVTARGATVSELLADLERRYPGMRFRMIDEQDGIRPHIRLYAGTREVRDVREPIGDERVLHLICALSGG
jgi:sulfur-carrier protein